jgi:pyrrolidone-carboxylate peptidase
MNSKLAKLLAKYARTLDDGVGEVSAFKPPKMPASSPSPLPAAPTPASAVASNSPKPPKMDPRLSALSAGIEKNYNTLLTPEMRAQDARDGVITSGLTAAQIQARNNYKLFQSMASGRTGVNDQNLKLLEGPRSSAGIWAESIARTAAPEAVAIYDTVKGVSEGKGIMDSARSAFSEAARSRAEYGNMFNDQLKRVANRYGANYELSYDDPLLDWGSYALEAAPSLALTALTGGGAMAARGTALASRIPGATFITRGFQPFAQASTNPAMRYVGSVVPRAVNTAISPINPLPIYNSLPSASNLGSSLISAGLTPLIFQNSANAYSNAIKDVNHYNQVNPDAGVFDNTGRFAQSLGSNVSVDPTAFIPGQVGNALSTLGVMPFLVNQVGGRFDQDFQNRLNQGYDILAQDDPERYQGIMTDPEQRANFEAEIRQSITNPRQYIIGKLQQHDPAQYAKLQADPKAMDEYVSEVQKRNPGLQGGGIRDKLESFISDSSPYILPSARSFGAVGFREQDAIDQQALLDAGSSYLASLAAGENPMENPKVQQAMQGASNFAKNQLASNMAQIVGYNAIPTVTGMQPEELTHALEQQDPSQLMQTPLGVFAQGDPQMVMEAADTMYGFQQAMPLLQQQMAQSGQATPEFIALIRAINAMQNSYQIPPTYGSQELHPGMQAIRAMQPILQALFERQQQGI